MQIDAHLGTVTSWPHQILLCMVRDQFVIVILIVQCIIHLIATLALSQMAVLINIQN